MAPEAFDVGDGAVHHGVFMRFGFVALEADGGWKLGVVIKCRGHIADLMAGIAFVFAIGFVEISDVPFALMRRRRFRMIISQDV
jgi:hypothetical protein